MQNMYEYFKNLQNNPIIIFEGSDLEKIQEAQKIISYLKKYDFRTQTIFDANIYIPYLIEVGTQDKVAMVITAKHDCILLQVAKQHDATLDYMLLLLSSISRHIEKFKEIPIPKELL